MPPGVGGRVDIGYVEVNGAAFFADDDSVKELELTADDGDAFATEHVRVRAGQHVKHVVKFRTGP